MQTQQIIIIADIDCTVEEGPIQCIFNLAVYCVNCGPKYESWF